METLERRNRDMSPRLILTSLSLSLVLLVSQSDHCNAQLTVQQPVFGVTGVSTTVSVPDRGRAHLGSISRARSSRNSYGPFRSGSNIGVDREHTGMSVGVYIHDFEAMDRYLLSQGTSPTVAPGAQLSGNARHAFEQLQAHHGGSPAPSTPPSETIAKAEKFWFLGQRAEKEGKLSVAKLHYRIASKYGSNAATVRLAHWDSEDPASAIAKRDQ